MADFCRFPSRTISLYQTDVRTQPYFLRNLRAANTPASPAVIGIRLVGSGTAGVRAKAFAGNKARNKKTELINLIMTITLFPQFDIL